MELDPQTIDLVRDAVFSREMKALGSFIFNKASEKLQAIGVSTLPEIEYVLLHEVMPCVDPNLDDIPKPFLGLGSVLVTYFQLCEDTHLPRAVLFLRGLEGILRIEAMRAINVVWFSQRPTAGIPAPFMDVINELTVIGSRAEKQVAEWLIHRQQNKDEEPKDFREGLFKHLRTQITPNS